MPEITKTVAVPAVEVNAAAPKKAQKKAAKAAGVAVPAKDMEKKAAKPAPAKAEKPAPKKAEKPAKTAPAAKGEIKWSDKRLAILKTLKKMSATSPGSARTAVDIAAKGGGSINDVKHYCYKDEQMVTHGFVAIAELEGEASLGYFITAKGMKKLAE